MTTENQPTRKITIQNGAIKKIVNVPESAKTLGDIKASLGRLGVTDGHTAYLMSEGGTAGTAEDSQVIEDGQSFQFSQNTGQKG
jgi:hypothetical protein